MTFAEYNTDENFNKPSNAMELVRLGKEEGKTREEIANSLSPLWKEDKKGNVKKALDYHFAEKPKEEPKAEEKPVEEKVTEKVIEQTAPQTTETKQKSKAANRQNEDSLTQEQIEYQNQRKNKQQAWDNMLDTADKQREAFNNIDDHMVEQLPTFMFKRYQNGEFGDPKSSDAKLRLAHFMINGVGTALSNMSHVIRKDGVQEQSDAEKYQQTNLEEGLKNRWQKYKEETQAAIDLAKQRGIADEDLNEAIAKISSNNRLQSSFNRMNEEQKVFTLQVMSEIGDEMGNMSDEKFFNTLVGFATSGDSLDYKEAAAMLAYRYIKDPDKRDAVLDKLGFGDMGGGLFGGLGGALGGDKKEEPNPETTLDDGTDVDAKNNMSKKELEVIRTKAKELGNKYYNGEIDEDKFRSEYAKLEKAMEGHDVRQFLSGGIMNFNDYLEQTRKNKRVDLSNQIDTLNAQAKKGSIKPSDYEEKFNKLKEESAKWGASEKDLKSIEKGKVSTKTIVNNASKNASKKKK